MSVDIWLERFGLAVLVAVFISFVLVNAMKFDTAQRVTLGVAVVALSLFVARTIQVTRAQAKSPAAPLQPMAINGPNSAVLAAPTSRVQSSPQQTKLQNPKPKTAEATQPPVQNIAPGGFAISGGTVTNPTVNNIVAPRGRLLSTDGFNKLSRGLQELGVGTAALVMYRPITQEMNSLGGQLQQAFKKAGWDLPGYKSTAGRTDHIMILTDDGSHSFVPDGIHCVGDSELYKQVLTLLKSSGLQCEDASKTLYPPPNPASTITIFIGRDLGQ